MRLSLVSVKRRPGRDGGPEEVSRRETLVEGETLRVGRGLDCDVTIPDVDVDHHHATLEVQDGRLTLLSVTEGKLQYGRKQKRRAILEPGVPVKLGSHTLTLEKPPGHADYALALEALPSEAVAAAPQRMTMAEVMPSRRRLAWILTVPVLVLTLIWPVWEALTPPLPDTSPTRVAALAPLPEGSGSHPTLVA
jgi:FOG: FHA domain